MTFGIDSGSILVALRHYFQDCRNLFLEECWLAIVINLYGIWVPKVVSPAPVFLACPILTRKVSFLKSLATFWMALGFILVASVTLFTLFEMCLGLDNVRLFKVGFFVIEGF